MTKRDSKGRFSKNDDEENNNLILTIPSFKTIIKWISIILILFPWIIIISKFNFLKDLKTFLIFYIKKEMKKKWKT